MKNLKTRVIMPYRRISDEDKLRLIRAFRNLEDYQLLADQLGIKRGTARQIIARAMRREDPENFDGRRRGGAHHIKVDDEMREAISTIIGENPAATLININAELRRRLPAKPHISDTYMSKVCRGLFFTLKKLEVCPADRNREDVKEQRRHYATWFLEVAVFSPRVIYIDESGYNVWTQRTRGRAHVGSRAVRTINGQRGENLTLILAVSPQFGVEHYKFRTGGTTSDAFKDFFAELTAIVGVENRCVFILDNAPCHRAVTSMCDNHVVKFLPPYSPMLTPKDNGIPRL